MALQDYQVIVLSHRTGATLAVFSGEQITMKYSRLLNGVGVVSLALPLVPDYQTIFAVDNYVEVLRTDPVTGRLGVEETYLVREFNPHRDDDNTETLIVGGLSLNHLIKRRLIYPPDDPLQAGGYSTKSGDATVVMRGYCREQMGDLASVPRQTVNLTIPPGVSNGNTIGDRLRLENLLDKMQDFAKRSYVDFQLRRVSTNALSLDIGPIGIDRTQTANYPGKPFVLFSVQRNNLNQPSLEIDRRDEQNYVYVEGQGQGAARLIYPLGSEAVGDSLYNRIEFKVDASNAEDNDPLTIIGQARDALRDKRAVKTFTHQPNDESPGVVYRADWDVGDLVTVAWELFGFIEDLRVTSIEITISGDDEQLEVTTEPR